MDDQTNKNGGKNTNPKNGNSKNNNSKNNNSLDKKAENKQAEEKKEAVKPTEDKAKADSKDAAKKPEEEKKMLDDMVDEGDLILEDQRESYPLTPANARFFRSKGDLISLELKIEGKEPEYFERIIILRAFPVTNPEEFLSVREPDSRKQGRGKEIGMIRRISDFDEQTTMLFLEELDRRYFSPELIKITSCKEKFGYSYWDAETSAGHVTFILNNPFSNIRVLEDGRIVISDIDGNTFEISDPKKLDPASYRKIEMYL